jgi:ribosomal protein S18 acetylase RimI-like enzyme
MDDTIEIPSPRGVLRARAERDADREFRYRLFCESRLPEWYVVEIDPAVREQLMQQQFRAQTETYLARFPRARFDIIEFDGAPVGRMVVNRPGDHVHIVDLAVIPALRGQGIGSALMRYWMEVARAANQPARVKVADTNDPSMQLYARLGFAQIHENVSYIEMEWRAG